MILLTAFEPFGGESINPALEVMNVLSNRDDVVPCRIPVAYRDAAETALSHPEFENCSAILMLGQAMGRKGLTVERVAVNIDDCAMPDNAGEVRIDQPILPQGSAACFATLPIKSIVSAVQKVGICASVSNTAGTYVCNHLMYSILSDPRTDHRPAGFIHLPALPEQGHSELPSMPLEDMVRGISAALDCINNLPR